MYILLLDNEEISCDNTLVINPKSPSPEKLCVLDPLNDVRIKTNERFSNVFLRNGRLSKFVEGLTVNTHALTSGGLYSKCHSLVMESRFLPVIDQVTKIPRVINLSGILINDLKTSVTIVESKTNKDFIAMYYPDVSISTNVGTVAYVEDFLAYLDIIGVHRSDCVVSFVNFVDDNLLSEISCYEKTMILKNNSSTFQGNDGILRFNNLDSFLASVQLSNYHGDSWFNEADFHEFLRPDNQMNLSDGMSVFVGFDH